MNRAFLVSNSNWSNTVRHAGSVDCVRLLNSSLTNPNNTVRLLLSTSMGKTKKDHLLGKLDLLVLRTLIHGEKMHGYAIAERIEQLSQNVLQVGEGSLYPALHRMDEAGWIRSEWGPSDNNRRARYYRITAAGRRQLTEEEADWLRAADAITRVLRLA
jgi:PadR family transcriptional regulator PadR